MSKSLLDDKEERYLTWLLTPEGDRDPGTQKELAVELEVSVSTLKRWREYEHFEAEYNRRWRQLRGGPENVKKVVDALFAKAVGGDNTAMKLYLEWARELKKDDTPDDTPRDLRDLTDEELRARLERTLASE